MNALPTISKLMRNALIVFSLLCSFLSFAEQTVIKTLGPQKPNDASHDYFVELLNKALLATNDEYGEARVDIVPHPGQERVMMLLSADKFYDVVWSGSSRKRDSRLRKVDFPLFKGGLGWRGSIIRKEDVNSFAAIESIDELSERVACQGMHWPDADVLEQAGLKIYRVSHFDSMLQMLSMKRCDYLPLSIFEGESELAIVASSFEELTFSRDIILSYPLTMNFYLHHSNDTLADRLLLGLERLDTNGELLRMMHTHPLTENAFPLTDLNKSRIFKLDNHDYEGDSLTKYGLAMPEMDKQHP